MIGALLHRTVVDKQAKKEHPDVPKVKDAIRPHYKQVQLETGLSMALQQNLNALRVAKDGRGRPALTVWSPPHNNGCLKCDAKDQVRVPCTFCNVADCNTCLEDPLPTKLAESIADGKVGWACKQCCEEGIKKSTEGSPTVRFGRKAKKKAKRSIVEQAKAADDETEEGREKDDAEEDEGNLQEIQTNKRKGPHAAKKATKTKNAGKGSATAKSTTRKRKQRN